MQPAGIHFATRFDKVTGSAIRETFKLLGNPNMINFAGGNPSNDALPDALCAEAAREVLLKDGKRILQYGATEGYPPFTESLRAYLKQTLGFTVNPQQLLPTTGSTSCMDLLCKALINPGDAVLVESPTFLGNMQTMNLYQANLIPVESDAEGILPESVEENAKRYHPKMCYVIPTFQNPTGKTIGLERRKALAALAEKYQFILIEDDPYRDLRYSGEALPTIKSFDEAGYVFYLGSFSKIISPGMRVGYMVGQEDIVRKCTIGKQGTDLHTPSLNQAIVDYFIRGDLLLPHIKSIIPGYREKLDLMLKELEVFPKGTLYTHPQGGLFIWVELPNGINTKEMLPEAVACNVAYVPGTFFYPDGGHMNTLRLNFSNSTPDQIHTGMQNLNQLIQSKL